MRQVVSWLGGILMLGAPVLAQTYEQAEPASMSETGSTVEWLIAAAFLVACLVVAFKPAKRSNLR